MDELKQVTRDLLASGAPIEQMNVVRKHLSQIAGGRLAVAATARGARVVALIVSDVTGDAPADIASGPCAADPSTYADAASILRRWNVSPPASIAGWLARGERGEIAETPKPGDPRWPVSKIASLRPRMDPWSRRPRRYFDTPGSRR